MFGENVKPYSVAVLNEREVRAGAGILFFFAIVVFMGAWHADQMLPAQLMIIGFFLDFLIRVIQPSYSPSLILGRLAVSNQTPEYTAAAPKRFAWSIGLALASFMIVTMIFLEHMSIVNFSICALCILLLFMESSFGICLGCVVYSWIPGKTLELCPGDVCEIKQKEPIQRVGLFQYGMLVAFFLGIASITQVLIQQNSHKHHTNSPNHPLLQEMKQGLFGSKKHLHHEGH